MKGEASQEMKTCMVGHQNLDTIVSLEIWFPESYLLYERVHPVQTASFQ